MRKIISTKMLAMLLCICMVLSLCACGTASAKPTNFDKLLGTWEYVGSFFEGEYYSTVEEYTTESYTFYEDGGMYLAEYIYGSDYYNKEYAGMKVEYVNEPFTSDCGNADWYYNIVRYNHPEETRQVALLEDGVLIERFGFNYLYDPDMEEQDDSELEYSYVFYVNSEAENKDDLAFAYRYHNQVTVSNIEELYNAIESGSVITLKEGIYNISDLSMDKRNNPNINVFYSEEGPYETSMDEIHVSYVSNLILKAEEGANVVICTNEPAVAPISFEGCNNISIEGITLGHEVEPGYCSGSVLDLNSSNSIYISDCNLYGSGAYGISAYSCSNIQVDNCDIYECTYGLLDFYNSYDCYFTNTKLRDSSCYTIFALSDCYGVYFNDCQISNNTSEYGYFLTCVDGYVDFTDCDFTNNTYINGTNGAPNFYNCTENGSASTFPLADG